MSATSDTTTATITLDPLVNKAPYRDADGAGVQHHHQHHQHDLAKNLPEPKSLKVRLEALVHQIMPRGLLVVDWMGDPDIV